jgi:UDP-4-amino-4,6-dideoxy-N-acetyl-beta-L-altrosamine transaminase
VAELLPYGRHALDDDDIAAVVGVLRGDWLTTGPAVARFEAALAAASGARRAVAVSSGTAALHAAYFAAGLRAGDEVVTSPLTFAATANAALYLGATVRFADVSPDTGNLDPEAAEAALTARTRLLVPVDFAGHPADYPALRALAERRGLHLVADAAHSLGATLDGAPVARLAGIAATSFHPVKAITTGEGGAVLSDDAAVAEAALRFRSHGMVRDPARLREPPHGPWYHEQHDLGFNYRLTDIQCALGESQLRKLPAFIARRRAIAARYDAALSSLEGIEVPRVRPGAAPARHLYVLRVREAGRRLAFFGRLRERGLGVQVHYLPVYLHPYYRALGHEPGSCPRAEDIYARSVSIPIFPRMSDADVDRVIETVAAAAREVL